MLTIGELAAYAGVTVRAVRHYHQIGLLAEPERDASGYRTYDAEDVVRLIRIRTLAEAGVPLSRVQELLEANTREFTEAVAQIDLGLRAKMRDLRETRRRMAQLPDGYSLALPAEVMRYLEKMRAAGISERLIAGERDGWILIAARWPEKIPAFMADKLRQLEDERVVRLYLAIDDLIEGEADQQQLHAVADLLAEMAAESEARGDEDTYEEEMHDEAFVGLVDSFALASHPVVAQLREELASRGWTGWTHMERDADAR